MKNQNHHRSRSGWTKNIINLDLRGHLLLQIEGLFENNKKKMRKENEKNLYRRDSLSSRGKKLISFL